MTPAACYIVPLTCPSCGGTLHGEQVQAYVSTHLVRRLAAEVTCEDCGVDHVLLVQLRTKHEER